MSRVLVTGAAGFLGSHLCDALLIRGYEVVGIDNLSMGSESNLSSARQHPGFSFYRIDVLDLAAMTEVTQDITAVLHLAAFKIPRYGKAIDTLRVNALGSLNVLDIAAKNRARIVMISTSDVYGKGPTLPFQEDNDLVLGPSTVPRWGYAVSKLFDEHLSFAVGSDAQLPVTVVRVFGSYGPRHHLSWWGGPQSCFISAMLRGEDIEIHGDGLQTRSFCYVDDTVDGIVRALESTQLSGEIINIGNNVEISIVDLARRIHQLVGTPGEVRIRYVPYSNFGRYEDVRRRVPDLSKARKILGYESKTSLEVGLEKTIVWQRDQLKL